MSHDLLLTFKFNFAFVYTALKVLNHNVLVNFPLSSNSNIMNYCREDIGFNE